MKHSNRGEEKKEPLKLPHVAFTNASWTDTWKCNRCGCAVFNEELELHSSFHKTQDVILEELMILVEKISNQAERKQ
ncbi:MAG TPA: hypothetical protein VJ742_05575 [Nitrososphaera sp.]|nr:hypothetical protein [Nitrososphaera sp.]